LGFEGFQSDAQAEAQKNDIRRVAAYMSALIKPAIILALDDTEYMQHSSLDAQIYLDRGSASDILTTMEMPRKRRGQPRKDKDTIEPWQFWRAAIVMWAYDEARMRGEKHSAAIREAVNLFKEHYPDWRISDTEVKRILARFRPSGSQFILRFERKVLTEDGIKERNWLRERLAGRAQEGQTLQAPPSRTPGQESSVFAIRIAERPNYPRHNCKNRQGPSPALPSSIILDPKT
jgi:hypothetical protein